MTGFVEAIIEARGHGRLVFEVPPLTLASGYAVAALVWRKLGTPVGWKIGATNAGGQQFLGIDTPICGRIFEAGLFQAGDVAVVGDRVAEVEPEILLRIGKDGAVVAAYLGLEVVRSSHDKAFEKGVGFIIADNSAHVAIVIGPEIPLSALDHPSDIGVKLVHNGAEAGAGDASMVLGNPLNALNWLRETQSVLPGDWIATGAMTRACPFATGDTVVADFDILGRLPATRVS